jgi:hypothetical protein
VLAGRKKAIFFSPLGYKGGHPNGIPRLNWVPVIKQSILLSYKNKFFEKLQKTD